MSEHNPKKTSCPISDPAQQTPPAELTAKRGLELAAKLHIVESGGGYHILQIPGADGAACTSWAGPFESESAAGLFREDRIVAKAACDPSEVCCSGYDLNFYNVTARFLQVFEQGPQEPEALARAITKACPWVTAGNGDEWPF